MQGALSNFFTSVLFYERSYVMKQAWMFLLIFAMSFLNAVELEIWVVQDTAKDALKPAISAFEKDFPEHKVLVLVDEKEHIVQKAQMLKEKGADIVVWGHDIIGKCIADDFVVPVEMKEDLKETLVPESVDAVMSEEKYWGYPRNLEFISLMYRKDKVDEKDLQGDFAQLVAKYPCSWDITNWYFTFPFFGKGFTSCESVLKGIQGEQFKKNTKDFASLLPYLPKDANADTTEAGFISGKYAIMVSGPWTHAKIKANGVDFGVIPLSNFTLGGDGLRPFLGVQTFLLNRYRNNWDLAKLLIEKYILNPENQVASYAIDPRIPSTKKALEELGISKIEGIPMPKNPSTFVMWDIMEKFLKALVKDGISEKIFDDAENKLKLSDK